MSRKTTLSLLALAALAAVQPALASDAHAHAPAPAPAAKPAAAKPAPAADVDPMDRLQERLGATRPGDAVSPNVLRVTARATAEPPAHGAAAPAPRKAAAPKPAGDGHGDTPHWAYNGEFGPKAWGGLKPEFGLCGTGKRQSPIDIRDGISVDLEPVQFDYRASGFRVIDNGHTVQVNVAPGNFIQLSGRRWELAQFHFHRPSEERIDGRQFDMVAHLVHKDIDGKLAVVAVLLERGSAQPIVQAVWNNLPLEKGEENAASTVIDLNHLLPPDRRYYTYMGSLTTPPCSEGVTWVVMRQPVQLSQGQIDIFSRLYPMNARPIQSASGRLIKQSQ
jgi:carbonic anhydrase